MRIAFYAPLKAPDHPRPSGDRQVARLLVRALRQAGHQVELAARLRSWDGGDPARQRRLASLGRRLAQRLLRRWRTRPALRPRAWLTYHPYHKAPDWIGPTLARELSIPYLVAEASHAPKQAAGPWAPGHAQTARGLALAAGLLNLNPEDLSCVRPLLRPGCRVLELAPFLDPRPLDPRAAAPGLRSTLARRHGIPPQPPWLIAVAMLRADVKLESYRLLARACRRLGHKPWQLLILGDGAAAGEVDRAFAGLAGKVHRLGAVDPEAVRDYLWAADLMVWPALGEAYGMALLEAQAAGLAVLAGARPGNRQILDEGAGARLVAEGDPEAFAAALDGLLEDRAALLAMGAAARARVVQAHSLPAAAARIQGWLEEVGL